MNIGDKISYLRKQKELSQTDLVLNLIDMAIGYTKTKKAMAS